MSRFFLICALIISTLIYSFPFTPPASAKKAQYVANYIKVDHNHEQGYLFGAVVGTPEVSKNGVKAHLRIYNRTDVWLGVNEIAHHAKVTPFVQTFGLIPPKSHKNYTVEFELEDDFVSFIYNNGTTASATYLDHLFRTFGKGIFIDALEMLISIPELQTIDLNKGWPLAKDILEIAVVKVLNNPEKRKDIRQDLINIFKKNNVPLSVPSQNALQGNINKFLDDKLHIEKAVKKRGFGSFLSSALGIAEGVKRAGIQIGTSFAMYRSYMLDGFNPSEVKFTAERLGNRNSNTNTPPPCQAHIEEEAKMETSWWPTYTKLPEEIVCANSNKILPKGAANTPQKANSPQGLEETQKAFDSYRQSIRNLVEHLKDKTIITSSEILEAQIEKGNQLAGSAEQNLNKLNPLADKLASKETVGYKQHLKDFIDITKKIIELEKSVVRFFLLTRDYFKAVDQLKTKMASLENPQQVTMADVTTVIQSVKETVDKEGQLITALEQFEAEGELEKYIEKQISIFKTEQDLLRQYLSALEKQDEKELLSVTLKYNEFIQGYMQELTAGMNEFIIQVDNFNNILTEADQKIRNEYGRLSNKSN